ncbi:MAG: hypothetical protein UT61_C0010G0017 [Candidatus Woesebacteria bacterium GW2011_GWA1_39_8]|uniref:Uncharacterized protein n=1 Tax=Candidatus Woesebacteria bacterium GW2011_GWA1_39_8 TaxID=1618552 RepID=A0A0G0PQ14_9BACT|nr:MAG: hypothetical protein UT61_C0010G0017 [Candidatus Woesebacteria bacterium GW2011_GWA1_39_8]
MLETPHVVVGAAIATKIPNPLIALPLALASHFVLDMVPHWNPHLNLEKNKTGKIGAGTNFFIAADVALSLMLGFAIAVKALPNTSHALIILLSAFVAVLPDLVEAPYYYLNSKSRSIQKWVEFQKTIQSDTSILLGLITQFATVIAAFVWIG